MPGLSQPLISQDFGIERLRRLLESRNVVLRHDVDFDPNCAVMMARLEAELGVPATFYIRPLEQYPSPADALACFIAISQLGGELSPHVDLGLGRHAEVPADYMRVCAEADHLSLSKSLPVTRKVSFHAPPAKALWRAVEGFQHAMTAEWLERYVADSRGVFRRSPEEALLQATVGRPIQLGLHPEWWFLGLYDRAVLAAKEAVAP